MRNYLTYVPLVLITILGVWQYQSQQRINELECDLISAFFAEREYTYPALRDMGYEPNQTATDIDNPITSKARYADSCE